MGNISNLFGGTFTPPPMKSSGPTSSPHEQLIDAILSAGYEAPKEIIFDGKIHRFSTDGRPRKDDGWYVAYDGKIYAGAFGSWRDGSAHNWRQDIGRDYTTAEEMEYAKRMKEMRQRREEESAKRKAVAAESCEAIWEGAASAESHPYLSLKRVKSHGLKVTGDGRLIVPMLSPDGDIASLQYIPEDGKDKRYHGGGRKDGVFYALQGDSETETVCIAEGYATAASIFEATGHTTYIAFDAGNLIAVAKMTREHHPESDIVVVADNDESGAGERHADAAAKACHGRYVMPPHAGMDANDYANSGGCISTLLQPSANDWLISADDFAAQPSPIRWLIKGYLQSDALIMVHGPSGGGKTFMVLDMCLHLAAGKTDWHGNIAKPGTVVYLAGEGHHGLRSRVAGWKQHHNASSLNMWLSKAGTDLNTPDGYNLTVSALDALPKPPALIVVDTLHRFLMGDENSAQDAKTMLDACNALQSRYNASVLLVHHTGVAEDSQHRARGSSAWRGALDIELSVAPATDTAPMAMIQRKSKDAELSPPIAAQLQSVFIDGWFDEDGEQVSTAIICPLDASGLQQANPKAEKYKADFLRAWESSGSEKIGDCEYVSRSALKEWLRQHVTESDRTIRNMLNRSRDGGMINVLIGSGIIREAGSGWIILKDGNHAAESLLSNLAKNHTINSDPD